jgi:hypothetical protein
MKSLKNLARLLCVLALLGASAFVGAQDPGASVAKREPTTEKKTSAQAGRTVGVVQPQPKGKAGPQPAGPVQPQRKPPPRRHVWQVVGPEPTVNLGPVYSPTLTPRPPATSMPAPIPGTAPVQPGPAPLNSCVGNLCTDASGGQYNVGVGNAGTDSRGRLCNRVGTTMQCF